MAAPYLLTPKNHARDHSGCDQLVITLMIEFYENQLRAFIDERNSNSHHRWMHMFNVRIAHDAGIDASIDHHSQKIDAMDACIAELGRVIEVLKKLKNAGHSN